MGDKRVTSEYDDAQMRAFTHGVLNDLQALDQMLINGLFEEDIFRIGAEQEIFLVDSAMRPAPIVTELMEEARDGFAALAGTNPPASVAGRSAAMDAKLARLAPKAAS